MGTLLICMVPLFRGRFSESQILWISLFLAASPTVTYFSRFIREDIHMAFFTLGMVVTFVKFLDTRRSLFLKLFFALLALSFCSKEATYITLFIFVTFFVVDEVLNVLAARGSLEETKSRLSVLFGEVRSLRKELALGVLIFAGIFVVLFSTFFTNPRGIWDGMTKSLTYWLHMHENPRIPGPFEYYVPKLFIYEPLILLFALGGIFNRFSTRKYLPDYLFFWTISGLLILTLLPAYKVWVALLFIPALVLYFMKRNGWHDFLIYWAVLSFIIYSWAQEKVPWLMFHIVLPMAVVAGVYAGELLERIKTRRGRRAFWTVTTGLLAMTLHHNVLVNFYNPADPKEELVYVQTSEDLSRILKEIGDVGYRLTTGKKTPITVQSIATWPLAWYLREYPVAFVDQVDSGTDAPLIIGDWEKRDENKKLLGGRYTERTYKLREWGNPNFGYDLHKVWTYLLYHDYPEETGSQKIVLYLRNDLSGPSAGGKGASAKELSTFQVSEKIPKPTKILGSLGTERGQLNQPRDISVGRDGRTAVVDTLNGRIVVFDPSGRVQLVFGGNGAGDGQFASPTGVGQDAKGNFYVADTWNHRIQEFDPSGKFLLKWGGFGTGDGQFYGPRDVEVSPGGEVFVSDTGNRRIQVFNEAGEFIRALGRKGNLEGEFVEQVGLAFDEGGNLYVADTGNQRVQVFDPSGKFLRLFSVVGWEEYFTEPYLSVQHDRIGMTDSHNNRIEFYTKEGKFVESWGTKGSGEGQFLNPIGIAFAKDGSVLVADTFNNRIQEFPAPERAESN